MIIDEVDNLSITESAKNFISFLHSILKTDTNTTIIGIANSVDLLAKVSHNSSKESELVEKKCIFAPYNDRSIVKIINKKKAKFCERTGWRTDVFDDKALEYAAKKVAKISGDIRVAFDLIKSALTLLILKFREEAVKKKKELEGNSEDETLNEEHKDKPSETKPGALVQAKLLDTAALPSSKLVRSLLLRPCLLFVVVAQTRSLLDTDRSDPCCCATARAVTRAVGSTLSCTYAGRV